MNLLHRHPDGDDSHHHHDHDHGNVKRRNLALALAITITFMVIEAVGGVLTDSLALLADAGHMLTDAAALVLALGAGWLAARPATDRRSFGFARAEVLAAAINAGLLIAISIYIFWEATRRALDPPEVESGLMLVVAVGGLVANAASAFVLSRGGGHTHDLNTRGAFLHVVSDMLGSVGAILAALVMMTTGWWYADPLLSAGIGLLILHGAWRLMRESVDVLMEATPSTVDAAAVREAIRATDGVTGVHDLHIWTVTSGLIALSAHVGVEDPGNWDEVLLALHTRLQDDFGIGHLTFQPESSDGVAANWHGCSIDSPEGRHACVTIRRAAEVASGSVAS